MEDFAVAVTMFSISGVHRSLFHPLATLRHRIWAGPAKETKKQLQYEHQQTDIVSMNKINTQGLPLLLVLLPSLLNTDLHLNIKFLNQYAVRCNIPDHGRRTIECTVCLLQLSALKWTTQLRWRKRNENKRHNEVKLSIFNPVLSAR
jgi:hypothetical protein